MFQKITFHFMKITKKNNNFTFQAEQSEDVNDAVKKLKKRSYLVKVEFRRSY